MQLTELYLRKRYVYDPITGNFIRLAGGRGPKAKVGKIAGWTGGLGYRRLEINNKVYAQHRLAWFYTHGVWPEDGIDHINGDTGDNRIENLRAVTQQTNTQNMRMNKRNTSGVTGVYFNKKDNKWQSYIRAESKLRYLGQFDDWFEAVCARKSANVKYGFHANHGRAK